MNITNWWRYIIFIIKKHCYFRQYHTHSVRVFLHLLCEFFGPPSTYKRPLRYINICTYTCGFFASLIINLPNFSHTTTDEKTRCFLFSGGIEKDSDMKWVNELDVAVDMDKSSVIRQKSESQNGDNTKTKHNKFSEKWIFLTPWYAI